MRQVFVDVKGAVVVEEVPPPQCPPGGVLVQSAFSLISPGTETVGLGAPATLGARIERAGGLIRKGVARLREAGIGPTLEAIRGRQGRLHPRGYSLAGTVLARGPAVLDLEVGDRVACGGAEYAQHAEVVAVPRNLVVRVPAGVDLEAAAFASLGAVGLQAVRQARVSLGETAVVIGLGLVGLLTVELLRLAGCRVVGVEPLEARRRLGDAAGCAATFAPEAPELAPALRALTGGLGGDAVLVCASGSSEGPVSLAVELARPRGRVVIVGAVPLALDRDAFYRKELELAIARSMGPGRYDPLYEEEGLDYPAEYVRWTENRNLEAFVQLLADRALDLRPLIARVFALQDAPAAYRFVTSPERPVGVLLRYEAAAPGLEPVVRLREQAPAPVTGRALRVAVVGAGRFTRSVHLPNLRRDAAFSLRAVVAATGVSAREAAAQFGAEYCTTDPAAVLADPDVDLVVIATPHQLHAGQAREAIRAGKHVFVEKPLCLTAEEAEAIGAALAERPVHFTVGFNRRFAPLARQARALLAGGPRPLVILYRVSAGPIPPAHWVHDPAVGGGRIVGEVCHFVDFCNFLVGEPATGVTARAVPVDGGAVPAPDNVSATLTYRDGSLATIVYTSLGPGAAGKERIEVFGGGRALVLDDFRTLETFGVRDRGTRLRAPDKGHAAQLAEFARRIRGEPSESLRFEDARAAMLLTFRIRDALR